MFKIPNDFRLTKEVYSVYSVKIDRFKLVGLGCVVVVTASPIPATSNYQK